MPRTRNGLILGVARLAARDELGHLPDADLLRRFARHRDAAAFEALVRRHGGMVLGVCTRVLGRGGDADDAFQAAFLTLVRRAGSVRSESVGGWLYRVARRAAVRAARQRVRRAERECRAARPEAVVADDADRADRADWRALLDREVERLPARFREAFVLCHLEERPHEEAARELGCPLGTLHSRLARAKERLRARLGATTPAAACSLTAGHVRAAVSLAEGSAATPAAVALSQGVWSPMTLIPFKSLAAVALTTATLGAGAVWFDHPAATATPPQASKPAEPTLDELKRENEKLRRRVAYLERQLAQFDKLDGLMPANPPTDAEVLRALPKTAAGNAVLTIYRDDIQIVKNKLIDRLDPPRFFPKVGTARLRHVHWECTAYFTETIHTQYPFPFTVKKPRCCVVYIDKDVLVHGPDEK